MSRPDYDEEKESIVFCEGYHDRDFWAGWLERLGWVGPGLSATTGARVELRDPWKKTVTRTFGFARDRRFVRVLQCGGTQNVLRDALRELGKRPRDELHHVIVNLDSDATDGGEGPAEARLGELPERLKEIDHGTDPEAGPSPGSYKLGGVLVSGVVWRADDPETPGVPTKQTLERLVASSLAAAYPERAAGVDAWLKASPHAAADGKGATLGKAYTWSYMAKWYPELGRDGFYRQVWRNEAVAAQLESRLRAIGAWSIAEAL
jgi:hypothetical protein